VTCGSSECQAAREYSLIRPPKDWFSVDRAASEVGIGEAAAAVVAVRDALGDALMRPGHVVVHLIFSQDGAQMGLPEDKHAIQ
jgi:hypothetical protein